MSPTATVVLALVLAAVLVAAWSRPVRRRVGGLISTDRKGRTTLVVWPAPGKRKRRKK